MPTNRRTYRYLAAALAALLLGEGLLPSAALALTSGPSQPEFSGFQPIATTNMVNDFTGSFSYNLPVISIPGPNGMGYALSLSYHNATSVEEEASWVGLGWTLNPGSIGRIKRGFPDEYKGAEVEYWNKVRDNWTASVTKRIGVEGFSTDLKDFGLSAGLSTTLRYNNYNGYGYVSGVNLGLLGAVNVSFTVENGKSSWGFSISPISLLNRLSKEKTKENEAPQENPKTWADKFNDNLGKQVMSSFPGISSSGGLFGVYSFNDFTMPTNTTSYNAETWLAAIDVKGDPLPDVGVEVGVSGSYSVQKSVPKVVRHAYGYMYSRDAEKLGSEDGEYKNAVMDYYIEKDAPYNKRDAFLGIPFSNADNFAVSGEGLSGNFRLHQRRPGHFRPAWAKSGTDIYHLNLDIHVGADIGVGGELGYGDHYLRVDRWLTNPDLQFADSEDEEPYFFRFADDMGGDVNYAGDDNPVQGYPSFLSGFAMPSGVGEVNAAEGGRSGRAAYIGFNTNNRLRYHPPLNCWDGGVNDGIDLRAYARERTSGDDANRISKYVSRNNIGDDVAEFAVTKEDGSIYIYGLPVYSREEAELQFGVQGLSAEQIKENFIAYKYGQAKEDVDYSVVGEVRKAPYPSMYLLTEILGPDYIDRTNDGPTSDDLGGYVRFNYDRKAGGNDKKGSLDDWYRWRTPYKGLHYQRNSLSDAMDDIGTVQSGYKEIYYLKSIETRTHIATFETSPRRDAYPAETDEEKAATDQNSSAADDVGSKKLYKLDRVRLYAKDSEGEASKILSTVNFEYDYSLCRKLPNSEMDGSERFGKLTLKRVWFEHEGVYGVQISPYEFGYEYHPSTFYPAGIQSRYPAIVNYGDNLSSDEQNPDYSPFDIDRWGNYQYHGEDRHNRFIPWVNQVPDDEHFDPAAWQLKWIKLPSGGEIQVQYEQNRYRYVQHKGAMAMVNLTEKVGINKYKLDLSTLGLTDDDDIDTLRQAIQKAYIDNGEQIYFKFLYALKGDNPALDQCSSEFITGYATVKSVTKTGSDIEIEIGNAAGGDYTLPEEVCKDFVATSRSGIVQLGTSCSASEAGVQPATDENSVVGTIFELYAGYPALTQLADDIANPPCATMNPANSWLRVPMTKDKLGGGIRVKRLLMYDPGLEGPAGEDVALYGSEYLYEAEDGRSSGVATNEPGIGREENPLVGLINKRRDKTTMESILSGNEREQFEGPIGESIMPGASVGYSRVVVRNIHQQKTGTGHLVEVFYTSRDYPFDLQYATSSQQSVRDLKTDMTGLAGPDLTQGTIGIGVASYSATDLWRTQGFRFVLNGMNGKPRSVTKYSGEYGNPNAAEVEQTIYDYYEPGENIPVMTGPGKDDIEMKSLGKEMEVVLASRTVEDIANDYGIQVDVGGFFGVLFPIPFGSVQGSYRRSESILKTHVTTKIVRYPAVQKRVTVIKDGIKDITEYTGFDAKSGKVVLTRSADGYDGLDISSTVRDGSYYSVTLPAWRYYPAMGQIADRQGKSFGSTDDYSVEKRFDGTKHYLLVTVNNANGGPTLLDILFPGDLVEIKAPLSDDKYDRLGVYHIGTIAGNRIELLPASYSLTNDYPYRKDVVVDMLRSANTNQLTTNAGSYTTYGREPEVTRHSPQ